MNYQTPCERMHTNQGWFENNGRSGYILKPDFMRNGKYRYLFYKSSFIESHWESVSYNRLLRNPAHDCSAHHDLFAPTGSGFDPNAERQPSAWKETLKIQVTIP